MAKTPDDVPLDRVLLFLSTPTPSTLPNSPLFIRLLRHAHHPSRTAIIDLNFPVSKPQQRKTYATLISDILTFRNFLRGSLQWKDVHAIERGDEVYIAVLAAGGYEWSVAMLGVLALGAAVVPMSLAVPVREVAWMVKKAGCVGLICGREGREFADEVVGVLEEGKGGREVPTVVEVLPSLPSEPEWKVQDVVVSSGPCLDDSKPALVIFTSGTTGKPKGCVLRRLYTHESAATVVDSFDISADDTVLHVLPVHHATGIGTSFFPFMNAGACIVFRSGRFDEEWMWERLCAGDHERKITVLSAVPTMYMRLMWHYEQHVALLPAAERARYDTGIRNLRVLLCGSSALQQRVQNFWTTLRGGRPILVRYGSSEVPSVIRVPVRLDPASIPRSCVGLPSPGLDWNISSEGELLLRSPFMFSKYLHDREATVAAHTSDGYFRTGDLAHVDKKGFMFIDGRLSTDMIKSGGYKIGALEVEGAILETELVKEVMVVGVEDEEFGQRVGAAVVVSEGRNELDIGQLRKGLKETLPGYKMPTLLRVVDGELPKGETGKVQKKILGPQYFPPESWRKDAAIQVWKPTRPAKL